MFLFFSHIGAIIRSLQKIKCLLYAEFHLFSSVKEYLLRSKAIVCSQKWNTVTPKINKIVWKCKDKDKGKQGDHKSLTTDDGGESKLMMWYHYSNFMNTWVQ